MMSQVVTKDIASTWGKLIVTGSTKNDCFAPPEVLLAFLTPSSCKI